ncbi:MAG: DUF1636 domain-containing protein [Pseudomonadota bacterium]
MTTTIFVCDTCAYAKGEKIGPEGHTGGEMLAREVERLADGSGLDVRRQACLMGCDRHCNTAITAPGKLTYVLGMFTPTEASARGLVEYARLHAESETGRVPFKQWPQEVKGHFVARVPAVGAANAE